MSKLSYCPISNISIAFLEFHVIFHPFYFGIQLSPYLHGSWLVASYTFLHCLYIDCLFVNTVFAQIIEYETPVLKTFYIDSKKDAATTRLRLSKTSYLMSSSNRSLSLNSILPILPSSGAIALPSKSYSSASPSAGSYNTLNVKL